MLAEVVDGPYAGRKFDNNDINLYTIVMPVGRRTFLLFPPANRWDDVTHDRITKNGPFEDMAPAYLVVRHPDRVELHWDETGDLIARAQHEAEHSPPTATEPLNENCYECAPAAEIPNDLGWFELVDEKERRWRCHELPKDTPHKFSRNLPESVFHIGSHYAKDLGELRTKLSDVLDRWYGG